MNRRGPPRVIPGELAEDVCLLVLGGVPTQEVADALGVSRRTVNRTVERRFPLSARDLSDARRLIAHGGDRNDVAADFGIVPAVLTRAVGKIRRLRNAAHKRNSELRLAPEEREEISRGVLAGESGSAIARRLGRAPSTVTREIRRSGGRSRYRGCHAQQRYIDGCARPKVRKLGGCVALRLEVEKGLANYWSPEQISADLRRRFPDDRSMQISHETIYQSVYVQGRGALRAELARYLRWKRVRRKTRSASADNRGKIPDMVMISDRPAEVEDRAVPGHWEGDLIIGRNGKSAIATLVERRSRYVMLAALPDGRTADAVNAALIPLIQQLPEHLRKSLTWDQGKELSRHAAFSVATGVQVYFCNPHSPWERGSNENTNGLLRQFLPRTADLSKRDQTELDEIARLMNHRPRQTLKWMKPYEVLNAAIGAATG